MEHLLPLQACVAGHHGGPQRFCFCRRPVSAHRHLGHAEPCRQHHHHLQRLRRRRWPEALCCLVSSFPFLFGLRCVFLDLLKCLFLTTSLVPSCSSGTSQRTNVISCVTVHDSDSSNSSPLSSKTTSQPTKSLAVIMPSVKSQPGESATHRAPAAPGPPEQRSSSVYRLTWCFTSRDVDPLQLLRPSHITPWDTNMMSIPYCERNRRSGSGLLPLSRSTIKCNIRK